MPPPNTHKTLIPANSQTGKKKTNAKVIRFGRLLYRLQVVSALILVCVVSLVVNMFLP